MSYQIHRGVRHAEKYKNLRETEKEGADVLLQDIISSLTFRQGETILDFGCGEGTLSKRHLAPIAEKLNGQVIGLDISSAQIAAAKKYNEHAHVEYVCGDIFSVENPLKERKFDKIFCVFVLDYHTDYS